METKTNTNGKTVQVTDIKNDLWLMLSLAVASNEFLSLSPTQRADLINNTKTAIEIISSTVPQ